MPLNEVNLAWRESKLLVSYGYNWLDHLG